MIVMDKEQIKKRQQIYKLKTLLFTENVTSKKLKSKITELKSIFKLIKKIIKEKINLIESNNNEKNKNEIKQQKSRNQKGRSRFISMFSRRKKEIISKITKKR